MNDRIEILVPDRWQHLEPNTVILQLSRRNVVSAAIDGHLMTAGHQTCSEDVPRKFQNRRNWREYPRSQNSDPH